MTNSADQGGRYPTKPKAEVDNTLRDLQNCFIIHSKYFPIPKGVSPFRSLFMRSVTKNNTTSSSGFLGQRFNNVQRAALLMSLVQYLVNSSWLW